MTSVPTQDEEFLPTALDSEEEELDKSIIRFQKKNKWTYCHNDDICFHLNVIGTTLFMLVLCLSFPKLTTMDIKSAGDLDSYDETTDGTCLSNNFQFPVENIAFKLMIYDKIVSAYVVFSGTIISTLVDTNLETNSVFFLYLGRSLYCGFFIF